MFLDLMLFALAVRIASGCIVLIWGDWQPHKLKQAAIVFSTITACYMIALRLFLNNDACSGLSLCNNYYLYGAAQNIAFTIFHIACARDAIRLKKGDRRQPAH